MEYIYNNDLLVAINKNSTIYYVHNDHLNTPRKITDSSDSVVFDWPNADPFGANTPTTNTISFNLRFLGQYFDNETRFDYNLKRYYNTSTGRYLQADPIELDGGQNMYNYVNNNPLNGIDPRGLEQITMNLLSEKTINDMFQGRTFWRRLASPITWVVTFVSDYYFAIEMSVKNSLPSKHDHTTITSHGSITSLNHMTASTLADKYSTGQLSDSKSFINRLQNGQSINIVLDACETGARWKYTGDQQYQPSYAKNVLSILKNKATLLGYPNADISITTPTGMIYWNFGVNSITQGETDRLGERLIQIEPANGWRTYK